jgi:GxxExxY protein
MKTAQTVIATSRIVVCILASPRRTNAVIDNETYDIIGAAMEVHRELGCGFHERVYRHPFAIELARRKVPHRAEVTFPINYKGQQLPVVYRVDFVCFGTILVELKALPSIGPLEHAQMMNYLKASKLQRALILNFGARSLQHRRIVFGLIADPVRR